eukprot:1944087-Amphidinium_carterae.1
MQFAHPRCSRVVREDGCNRTSLNVTKSLGRHWAHLGVRPNQTLSSGQRVCGVPFCGSVSYSLPIRLPQRSICRVHDFPSNFATEAHVFGTERRCFDYRHEL